MKERKERRGKKVRAYSWLIFVYMYIIYDALLFSLEEEYETVKTRNDRDWKSIYS